jgi:hypothetical protein
VAIRSRARAGGRNSCLARRKVVEGMGGIPALLASAFLPSRGRSGYLRCVPTPSCWFFLASCWLLPPAVEVCSGREVAADLLRRRPPSLINSDHRCQRVVAVPLFSGVNYGRDPWPWGHRPASWVSRCLLHVSTPLHLRFAFSQPARLQGCLELWMMTG